METPEQQTFQTFINWVLGALMALIGSVLSIYRRKIDDLEKAHADVRVDYIPRDELERRLDDMAETRATMHADNMRRLERIEDSLTRLYERIDSGIRPAAPKR